MIGVATRSDGTGLIIVICCAGIPALLWGQVRARFGSRPTPPIFNRKERP